MKKPDSHPTRPIRTDADYRAALALVASYFDDEPEVDSNAGSHFETMLTLIEAYEAKHYPMNLPDPIKAILFRMEQQGSSPKTWSP